MKFRNITILSIVFLFIIGCSNTPEPDTLLRLGNKNYSLLEFFKKENKDTFIKIPEKSKIKKIEKWANNELIMFAAENDKYTNTNESLKKELVTYKKQADVRFYLDRTILDTIITEESLKKLHEKMSREIGASHILIQYKTVNPQVSRNKDEAIKLAKEIVKKAKSGDDFGKLATKYSDDKSSGPVGSLGYFGWGKMVGPFQEAAFSMKVDEISDIVETKFGYHIIKVNDIKTIPTKSFAEEKPNLMNLMMREKNPELRKSYQERVDNLKKEYNFDVNQTIIDTIIKKVTELKKTTKQQKKLDEISILKKLDLDIVIGNSESKDITIKMLINKLENSYFRLPPSFVNQKYFKGIIENLYITDLFINDLKKRNIPYTDEYKTGIKNNKQKKLIEEYQKQIFNQEVKISDSDMEKYYDVKKEKLFMNSPKSEVREIYLEDKEEATKLLEKVLQNKDKFEEYSKKYTERNNKKEKPGYLGKISTKQYGKIGKIANKTKANTIHPDLINVGKGWTIIKVYSKEEATPKDFKEVQAKIKRTLEDKFKKENKEKIMKKLAKKYNFKIYWECVNIEK